MNSVTETFDRNRGTSDLITAEEDICSVLCGSLDLICRLQIPDVKLSHELFFNVHKPEEFFAPHM